jgi:hypothetical protein
MRRGIMKTCCMFFYLALSLSANAVSCLAQSISAKGAAQSIFEFHSGFWINLHHFLYLEAISKEPRKGTNSAIVSEADAATVNSLSVRERATWNAAVSYYAGAVIQRDLLFDSGMGVIKNQLEDVEASQDLANAAIPTALKLVLLNAAPIYRKYWWTRHNEQNRKWIAQLQPLVSTYGEGLKNSLAKVYETPWPGDPVRVDAVVYGGQFGADTTDEPTRPTISTTDPANQGNAALEIVFHETSHGMMDKVMDAMRGAEAHANTQNQHGAFHAGTLWHAVLFYTAGELVAEQIRGYISYADKNGLWMRAWRDPDRSLIEQDWKPHMNGAVGLQASLTKVVDDLAAARQQQTSTPR